MLINGVIWAVPLPGVEILKNQELYISYDWEYWYRKWLTCDSDLRVRIAQRYPIAMSVPSTTNSNAATELERVSDFWYKHWSWWSSDSRRIIKKTFKRSDSALYHIDAETETQDYHVGSDDEIEENAPDEPLVPDANRIELAHEIRRHPPISPIVSSLTSLPAPSMAGPSASPTTNLLPQSAIDQADRPTHTSAQKPSEDLNNRRPAGRASSTLVWTAETREDWKVPTNMYSEVSGKHWKNFCSVMNTWHDNNDDTVASIATSSDLRVGYLNVNRLEDHNFDYIIWFYEFKRIDVLFLIDTRLTVLGGQYANSKIKERLGNDALILQSKTRPEPGS